ncbi:MAG: adenosylcobinamide-GDP ribazoletransferase [Chlorobium sp.]|nr:adenosylcobinamide-GDP ribazoletransferase [Chlorobium sp.]MCW8815769.1 adenosylcobinamide-GDP ribazoletransferase [Chlorobium sp.]MCW8819208.1 adenosylcobinamide-GDP ribazoletransferase [Ignavibacteriaceae bacterium]
MRGLVTALRTLTVLPVPGKEAEHFSSALFWFPLVGLFLGLLQAGAGYVAMLSGWPELAAAMVLFSGVLLTRGMHADGFADMADGFFGGRDVETRLRIMKDPSVGSFGAIGLILLFLFKSIVLVKLLAIGLYPWIVSGVLLARLVQVALASMLPYARREGGTAAGFVDGAGIQHFVAAFLVSFVILLFLMNGAIVSSGIGLSAAIVGAVMTSLLTMKKIGGVTGDVLGASSELTEMLVWMSGVFLAMYS